MPLVLDQDTESGDLVADRRGLRLRRGPMAVAILGSNALRQQPGEDLLDPSRGTPWPLLLGKNPSPAAIRGFTVAKMGRVSGVVNVESCEVEREGADMVVDMKINTDEGDVELVVALPGG